MLYHHTSRRNGKHNEITWFADFCGEPNPVSFCFQNKLFLALLIFQSCAIEILSKEFFFSILVDSMGRIILAGGAAVGLGALCYYGLGMSNEIGAIEKAV